MSSGLYFIDKLYVYFCVVLDYLKFSATDKFIFNSKKFLSAYQNFKFCEIKIDKATILFEH